MSATRWLPVLLWCAALAAPAAAQEHADLEQGRKVYEYWCTSCHGGGRGFSGTTALEAKYKGLLPAVLEDRTDLSTDVIRFFVRRGASVMPFFRKTELSDADVDAIAAYLRRPRVPPAALSRQRP